ncbi:MAG: hypothetical protein A3B37_02910 [Candidatus Sungbacteria bacterium RIFCSPLOWO2_01_FULL_59_16]|uniref:HTH merR-type domain-containing protein n=1 Tax=Candidatus Sungbacteria bacterium RIFCSPLOWO2_01_FULL_59_16 TaxID=1802280 RepID=A0A1G2LBF5_9BACT|nr:MAG: hypothetical protein A3B37_02910 [Candidatus Sungbacteria bacterium RIFCSPLOWO2_01_FULL_59_16]
MNDRFITIKQAAALLDVTPLTLRNWDKKGLLAAYRHPVNNYRLYRHADIENLLLQIKQPNRLVAQEPPPVQRLQVNFEDGG